VYSINGSTSGKTVQFIESLRAAGLPVVMAYDDSSLILRDIETGWSSCRAKAIITAS
jgi:hypothetical protein